MKNMKFGLIGCGAAANHHVDAMKKVNGGEFKSVYGAIKSQCEEFAEKNGLIACSSMEELLNDDEIETVTICTPSGTHADIAVLAMENGKNVVVEKPLALNIDDCRRVIETSPTGAEHGQATAAGLL